MIALLNGSPKAAGSNSALLLERLKAMLTRETVAVSSLKPLEQSAETLASCDTVVVVFPLYVDAIPSHLLRLMMEWEQYRKAHGATPVKLYAVAQCGFYEGRQNQNALEVLSHFCSRAGIRWCGGIGLGGAGGIAGMPEQAGQPLYSLLSKLADAVNCGGTLPEPEFAQPAIPRLFYLVGGNMNWVKMAKQNGLRKKEIYRKN